MKSEVKKPKSKGGTSKQKGPKTRSKGVSAVLIIIVCAIIAYAFFYLFCGAEFRFDAKGHPINSGDPFAVLFQGGFVIPMVLTLFVTVVALSIERAVAMGKANGKEKTGRFVAKVKAMIDQGDIQGARTACAKQGGSAANVINAALLRYEDVERLEGFNNSEKAAMIQKEVEDATTLELPFLEQNLTVIATISSLGTLFGLLGTVLGMIKSFAALASEGAPDSTALSLGISEALMNTALGIATGASAIISYGFFSTKVTNFINAVDEVGFAIGQSFIKNHGY